MAYIRIKPENLISDYNLLLGERVIEGASTTNSPITYDVLGWNRTIKAMGGYWFGNFEIVGELADLAAKFYEWLSFDIVERASGQVAWEGMIYEMDLTAPNGITRRMSMDDVWNYSRAQHTTPDNTQTSSPWDSVPASITMYGKKETENYIEDIPEASAANYVQRFLQEHAWPWARPVGTGQPTKDGTATLTGICAGYAHTAAWQFASDDAATTVNGRIIEIIENDCQFLSKGGIAANAEAASPKVNSQKSAWDYLMMLVKSGNADGDPFRLWVDTGRKVHYKKIDTAPVYYYRDGELYSGAGSSKVVNTRLVRPAVIRDMQYLVGKKTRSTWLTDARDFYMMELEVQSDGALIMKPGIYDESEILAAALEEQKRLDAKRGGGGGGGGGGNRPVWLEFGIYDYETWAAMSGKERKKWKATWKSWDAKKRKKWRAQQKKGRYHRNP